MVVKLVCVCVCVCVRARACVCARACEFILMKSDSSIQICYNAFIHLNSCIYEIMNSM